MASFKVTWMYARLSLLVTITWALPNAWAQEPTASVASHDAQSKRTAPAPIFTDPNYGGSCDPEVVWNDKTHEWWVFYTARRAARKQGTYVGTPIGIAASRDFASWRFIGYCSFDGRLGRPNNDDTRWAPGIVRAGQEYHMFVTFKDNATPPWGGPGTVRHYTAKDHLQSGWKRTADPDFPGPDPIDVTVIRYKDIFRAYYRVDQGGGIQWSESDDLFRWTHRGACHGDVNEPATTGWNYQEAPYVFRFANAWWMLTDPHDGLAVYRSGDAESWTLSGTILKHPGKRLHDDSRARHPSVAVVGDRAWIVYHVEPHRPYPSPPPEQRTRKQKRSYLQIAELRIADGKLNCNRDAELSFPRQVAPRLRSQIFSEEQER